MFIYVATRFPFNSNFLVKSIQLCCIKKALFLLRLILLPNRNPFDFFLNFQCFIPILFIKLHTTLPYAVIIPNSIPQFPLFLSLCVSRVDFDEPFPVLLSIYLFHFDIGFSTHIFPLLTEFHF